ncbi:penicillin binding protein PBP4B [Cytobacillus purgationiresistens]|uniref:CubicO group peptidase (Beta-lactamase class C family) n=1 Tax=Cytobacillus purgationiresistens TaxID=863449 RepID=A0ABU0AMR8_9BACI|nr:penicillin binding protein PBP4B [Cytobacillus purgationiresistens]MDQ0272092.1 CubicO group peptidase (beta-lactamase class C family) [Cytobacillus purgationiresistens]
MKKSVVLILILLLLLLPLSSTGSDAANLMKNDKEQQWAYPIKHGYPTLKKAKKPEEAGFSSKGLKKVDQLIEAEVNAGFPGAVLIVIKDGKIVKEDAYGYSQIYEEHSLLKKPKKMKASTIFDLASNTKMYATNFALQHLVSTGALDINETVQYYLPDFKNQPEDIIKRKEEIRVKDLLQHVAGFPSSIHYHNPDRAGNLYSQDREKTFQMLLKTPLENEPGTAQIYSDIDYMLLGMIVEEITGQQLDAYVEKNIYKPLKLKATKFNPLNKGEKQKKFAATELLGNTRDGAISFPNIRNNTLQGEVHDEKAFYSMGGVSGHAGLFSTTADLAILMQVMLNGGGYGKVQLFDEKTIQNFISPSDFSPTFGLGWRINGNESMEWMFSEYASKHAFGHTGWTGTVTIIDKENDLAIALLTNKKHSKVINPSKEPNKFHGDTYGISEYGNVVKAVYEAMIR